MSGSSRWTKRGKGSPSRWDGLSKSQSETWGHEVKGDPAQEEAEDTSSQTDWSRGEDQAQRLREMLGRTAARPPALRCLTFPGPRCCWRHTLGGGPRPGTFRDVQGRRRAWGAGCFHAPPVRPPEALPARPPPPRAAPLLLRPGLLAASGVGGRAGPGPRNHPPAGPGLRRRARATRWPVQELGARSQPRQGALLVPGLSRWAPPPRGTAAGAGCPRGSRPPLGPQGSLWPLQGLHSAPPCGPPGARHGRWLTWGPVWTPLSVA